MAHRATATADAGSTIEHDFRRGCPASRRFVDRVVHAADRRPDAGDVQGPGRGRRRSTRQSGTARPRRIHRHDRPSSRLDHRHRHRHADRDRAATRSAPACAARRSPVKRIDRFDPSPFRSQVAAQIDDFDPLAWMPPKTARQLDRFSQFGLVAGRLALDDARLVPGADGAPSPERIGIYLGSALGGIAYAEEQHERYHGAGHPAGVAEPGARRVRRRGAGQPRHRPRRPRADPVDRELVRVGCASRSARRSAICARAASMPRSPAVPRSRSVPLAFGAFDIIRALSAGHNDDAGPRGSPVRRRARWVRHGRGCRAARARGSGGRRPPRRHAVRRDPRLRRDVRRPPHGPAARRRPRGRPRGDDRARGRRHRGGRDRLRQRPRVIDADRRRRRGPGAGAGPRRARGDGPRQRHQGAVRAPARRIGRDRGGDLRARDPRWLGAGLGQPGRAGARAGRAAAGVAARRAGRGPTGECSRPRSASAG